MENYQIVKRVPLPELKAELIELEHTCGARVLHIANDDDENLFSLSLQTHPTSSNGVAHILEHTVLCGSEKFPVKDPFFSMIRRSLNTFMNAMTGADFTCYPAASQVEKDFYNLLDVYIDAVFAPKLKELSFKQEGHRFDFDGDELVYKGIVFNEMKGYKNSADGRIWHKLLEQLYPDLTYHVDSGGDPVEIPDLSYQEFLDFHKTFYHPSRCLFFFYGDLPLEKHLDYLHERLLHGVERVDPIPAIPKQARFQKPVHVSSRYPTNEDDLEKKAFVSFAFLTCPLVDQEELLALGLIDSILMETDASPLKFALQNSGMCVQADSHFDTEMSEAPWVMMCRGCDEESAERIEKLMFQVLAELVTKGIPEELIEASLHQMELSRLEITGGGSPYGLTLFFRAALAMQHGGEAENTLKIHSLFSALREKLAKGRYLEGLIQKYFLDNPHHVRLVTTPDANLEKEEADEEKGRLAAILAKMSEEEKATVRREADELEDFQESQDEEPIDCLPKLTLDDVPDDAKDYPLKITEQGGVKLYTHNCFTNGMVYAGIHFPLPELKEEQFFDLSLLVNILTEVGAGDRSFQENLQAIQASTGGISSSVSLFRHCERGTLQPRITLHGKALDRNGQKMADLMREIATGYRLDEVDRIKELIMQIYTMMGERIKQRPIGYAISRSLSAFSPDARIKYLMNGLPFFDYIEEIALNLETKLPEVIERLKSIGETVLHLSDPEVVISGEDVPFKLERWGSGSYEPWNGNIELPQVENGSKAIPSGVAFTCFAIPCVGFSHPLSAALHLASELFEHKVLHPKIREQGGAYGGRASYQPLSETFYFYSYQDPHLERSLNVFREAVDEIGKGNFDSRELEEAKLSYVQDIDAPTAPGSRASLSYGYEMRGRSRELREAYRKAVLAASYDDVCKACQTVLKPALEKGVVTTLAGEEMLKKEKCSFEKIENFVKCSS